MSKTIFFMAFMLLLIGSIGSNAQTAKEFQARYGKPIEVYEISPGILVYPKFGVDGNLIEARIQRAIATGSTIYLDSEFPDEELTKILNELVPLERRGKRSDFSGLIIAVGPGGTQSDDYENVRITRYFSEGHGKNLSFSGTMAVVVEWKPSFYKQK